VSNALCDRRSDTISAIDGLPPGSCSMECSDPAAAVVRGVFSFQRPRILGVEVPAVVVENLGFLAIALMCSAAFLSAENPHPHLPPARVLSIEFCTSTRFTRARRCAQKVSPRRHCAGARGARLLGLMLVCSTSASSRQSMRAQVLWSARQRVKRAGRSEAHVDVLPVPAISSAAHSLNRARLSATARPGAIFSALLQLLGQAEKRRYSPVHRISCGLSTAMSRSIRCTGAE